MNILICEHCGKKFLSRNSKKKFCTQKCKAEAKKKAREENDQLCWRCENACGGCSWSKYFIPVEGWVAQPTIIKDSVIGTINSFRIKECPNFIEG